MTSETLPTEEFRPPSDKYLRNSRLTFLRTCKPKLLKELRASGELEEHLDMKVEATKRDAANQIACGIFPNQAWFWAERVVILEREPD